MVNIIQKNFDEIINSYPLTLTLDNLKDIMTCSIEQARKLCDSNQFPVIRFKTNIRVSKLVFFKWLIQQNNNECQIPEIIFPVFKNLKKFENVSIVKSHESDKKVNKIKLNKTHSAHSKLYRVSDERRTSKMIAKNLESIEAGLKLVDLEFALVNGGFIDILAKDKNDILCIIEVKVNGNDKRVIFQAIDYPLEFNQPTRVIIMSPYYHPRVARALMTLENIEIKEFKEESGQLLVTDYTHVKSSSVYPRYRIDQKKLNKENIDG